jgi:hypothetical protein
MTRAGTMRLTTRAAVESLVLPAGTQDKIFFDDELPGFGIRLRGGGRPNWIVQYRIKGGKQSRIKLGSVKVLAPDIARKRAKDILAAAQLGWNPATEMRAAAAEKRAAPLRYLEQSIACNALAFLQQGREPACYLYRHYHPNGDLLYVGISLEPLRRQDRHVKAAAWRTMIYRILIEPFATREEALAAEEAAIRNEFPKFNSVHNGQRHPFQELGRK